MGFTVISSTPSPYARKVRINMIEQGIPFTLQTEVPWNRDTETPKYNPLEKLPVLIRRSDTDPSSISQVVYESKVILDYLNINLVQQKLASRSLLPADPDARLAAKQLEALADGIADAMVISAFEERREKEKQSAEWADRQYRKLEGGLRALDQSVRKDGQGGFLVGGELSVADVAVGSLLGFLGLRKPEHPWQVKYPALKKYWLGLEERESFKQTKPEMFQITDKVV